MIKTGIILASKKNQLTGLPQVWKETDWSYITNDATGEEWAYITSFDHYWSTEISAQFDHVYDQQGDFQNWLQTGIIKYTDKTIEL